MEIARFTRIVHLGVKSLLLHKLRSFLTVLGIIFGVCSVISMLSIGGGASKEAQEQIKQLGTNNILIRSVKPSAEDQQNRSQERSFVLQYGLSYDDAKRIATTIPSVEVVVPMREIAGEIRYRAKMLEGRVVGTVPWFPEISHFQVGRGRFISYADMEYTANVCVIGAEIARKLFQFHDPLGQKIKAAGQYFEVVGIMQPKSVSGNSPVKTDVNRNVYIPLTTATRWFGELLIRRTSGSFQAERVQLHQLNVKVKRTEQVIETSKAIRALLQRFHKKQDFEIIVPLELLRQAERTKRIFNIVLGSIAAISLLVGGIGIMNIMLATVTERTREIGVRRALGAKRRDIISQFLVESTVLSVSGGIVGIVVGVVIPFFVTRLAHMPTVITIDSLILSFGISVAAGVVFGLYPAWRAAQMDPIEALRHE